MAVGLLSGCAATVSLDPAPAANDPRCAGVMVALPGTVAGQQRRWTDAQSTAAWGSPSAVIFECGVAPPTATTERCITLAGIDWVVDEKAAPRYLVTTFGRTPAVQLMIDNRVVGSNDVLADLAPAITNIAATAHCTGSATLPK